ncbi:MAG: hypothetical protein H6833_10935 [Planctomycetes bacterium]|nr:hypothetical protein [Planctomycetota bacterium]
MLPILRWSSATFLLAYSTFSTAFGQTESSFETQASSLNDRFVCLQDEGDELWGFGANYKARFDDQGLLFIPALGMHEPTNRHLTFTMSAVGRSSGELTPAAAPHVRTAESQRVEYVRSSCVERYDVRSNGLKQSFVFETLPAERGDLIVRGTLRCDMPVVENTRAHLRFATENGDLFVRGVLGIDADGNQTTGTLDYDGEVLELRLPGSFVERAALPLTLDPLIGSNGSLSRDDDEQVRVAHDYTNEIWLAVWRRLFSATDGDIRSQRIDRSGGLVGSGGVLAFSSHNESSPSVANVNYRDRFVAMWKDLDNTDVVARSVDASDGSMGTARIVGVGDNPRVGGNQAEASTYGSLVPFATVLNVQGQGFCFGAFLNMGANGTLSVITSETRVSSYPAPPFIGAPNVSDVNHDGLTWFVWETETSQTSWGEGIVEIGGSLRRSDLSDPLNNGTPILISQQYSNPRDNRVPSVAASGDEWVVTYHSARLRNGADDEFEIHGTHIKYTPNTNTMHFDEGITILAETGTNLRQTLASWNGDSLILIYRRERNNGTHGLWTTLLSVPHLQPCVASTEVASGSDVRNAWVATRYNGAGVEASGAAEESIIVYSTNDTTNEVLYRRYRHDDGNIVNLGGACGTAGDPDYRIQAQCAVIGNANHRTILDNGDPNTDAYLVINTRSFGMGCSGRSCNLVPDPFGAIVVPVTTDADGYAQVLLPLPADGDLIGLQVFEQWIVRETSPACAFLNANLSDALSITIQ